jgi:hypothetical protein
MTSEIQRIKKSSRVGKKSDPACAPKALIGCLAHYLAGSSIDEMQRGAGNTGNRLVLVFGNIWIVIQFVLDSVAGHLKTKLAVWTVRTLMTGEPA